MDNTRFWIVLMEGNRVPPGGFHAHYKLGDAEIEAARLIRKERRPIVIMEAIMKGELAEALPPIRWVGMGPSK